MGKLCSPDIDLEYISILDFGAAAPYLDDPPNPQSSAADRWSAVIPGLPPVNLGLRRFLLPSLPTHASRGNSEVRFWIGRSLTGISHLRRLSRIWNVVGKFEVVEQKQVSKLERTRLSQKSALWDGR